ncbi:unnamed protein product, partial [Linum tenue]
DNEIRHIDFSSPIFLQQKKNKNKNKRRVATVEVRYKRQIKNEKHRTKGKIGLPSARGRERFPFLVHGRRTKTSQLALDYVGLHELFPLPQGELGKSQACNSLFHSFDSLQGHELPQHTSSFGGCCYGVSSFHGYFCGTRSSRKQARHVKFNAVRCRISNYSFTSSTRALESKALFTSSVPIRGGLYLFKHKLNHTRISSNIEVAGAVEVINDLGLDTLTFLAVTVIVVPAFRFIKASPILGFFFAGVVLNQFGFIRNLTDVKVLSEWGILFLLFEMGLELSLARLKALAKFAFGMGLTQVVLSTLAFTAFELPPNGAIGTRILEFLFHSRSDLVNIRSIDEAIVIGAALSLSSSAFVLQLLAEKGELPTRFGSATLGILLFQDIAVVPLLVVLPILESQVVAEARSSEAFVALCLLTVAGTSLITQKLGFSDTLGAFLAGAILAETNFRTQIEADIRPFRGLLLGLFFVTTGTSIDMELLLREWPNVLSLLGGLIVIKTLIITAIGPRVGLTLQESVRIGLLLSQGGEFAFVVFSLANRLGVLPLELNKLLIIVVVLSMALTPWLNDLGRRAADFIEDKSDTEDKGAMPVNFEGSEPVVILGFGQMGQVLANLLGTPLASAVEGDAMAGMPYVAFELNPSVVKASRKIGFPILYGDGSSPEVLRAAGISSPKAVMITYTGKKKSIEAIQKLRLAFPGIPIYARAQNITHLLDLKKAGATDAILENAETSLQLGSKLLKGLGVMSDDVNFLSQLVRDSMEMQAQEAALRKTDESDSDIMKPLQVRVSDSIAVQEPVPSLSGEEKLMLRTDEKDESHVLRLEGKAEEMARSGSDRQQEDV